MIFVGYDDRVKGYRCANSSTKKVTVSRNVKFFDQKLNTESRMHYSSESGEETDITGESVSVGMNNSINTTENVTPGSSINGDDESVNISTNESDYDTTVTNDTSESGNLDDSVNDPTFITRANTNNGTRTSSRNRVPFQPYQMGHFAFLVEPAKICEPTSFSEVEKSADKNKWLAAMDEEVKSHKSNNTWTLVDLPKDRKAITAKWVYKLKNVGTDNPRYKARLVARGYAQIPGVDFDETFSPVVRHTSLRIMFALAIKNDMSIFQMDAVTAFLQSELNETIYIHATAKRL